MALEDKDDLDDPDLADLLPRDDIDPVRQAFDAAFYLSSYPDVPETGLDPLVHYLVQGWKQGHDPSADFSTAFYLEDNPDVAAAGVNPFWHYIANGRAEGRVASAADKAALKLPDHESLGAELAGEIEAIEAAFDTEFYLAAHPDVAEAGLNPVLHYALHGWKERRDPSAVFSTRFYLEDNPDVAAAGVNPLWHYMTLGQEEGRMPRAPETASEDDPQAETGSKIGSHPEVKPEAETATETATETGAQPESGGEDIDLTRPETLGSDHLAVIEVMRADFDATYYLNTHPDVAAAGVDPLQHFAVQGWREGRDPNADFSTRFYLGDNPDVAAAGVNPFWHYVVDGQAEGRAPRGPVSAETPGPEAQTTAPQISLEHVIDGIRADFDSAYYLSRYPDVAKSGVDPLQHYAEHGWLEGRDPNAEFSTSYYLASNPDIQTSGFNPFWHYCVSGRNELRFPRHPGGHLVEHLIEQVPLEETVKRWRSNRDAPATDISASVIAERVSAASGAGRKMLIVSVSHDNYRTNPGGIQVCVQREQDLAAAHGAVYLNLHPVQPLPRLCHADGDFDPAVELLLDGESLGRARLSALVEAASQMAGTFERTEIVVHQLLGLMPELIVDLARAAGVDRCWMWLHDYLTICPSYTLQRNNIRYCGAPALDSNACRICLFGDERITHSARMRHLFEALDVHLLSPSQVTADIWTARSGLTPASLRVCPHMTLDWVTREGPPPPERDAITIGFLGTPVPFKGWTIFERLVQRHNPELGLRFVYCGTRPISTVNVETVPVHVTSDDPTAMIDAVAAQEIDLVLHWATWPETFSLSCYEALAGGAYVLTNPVSGNVAATVEQLGCGAVLADEASLVAFFEDGRARAMVDQLRAKRRETTVRHTISDMSFVALREDALS